MQILSAAPRETSWSPIVAPLRVRAVVRVLRDEIKLGKCNCDQLPCNCDQKGKHTWVVLEAAVRSAGALLATISAEALLFEPADDSLASIDVPLTASWQPNETVPTQLDLEVSARVELRQVGGGSTPQVKATTGIVSAGGVQAAAGDPVVSLSMLVPGRRVAQPGGGVPAALVDHVLFASAADGSPGTSISMDELAGLPAPVFPPDAAMQAEGLLRFAQPLVYTNLGSPVLFGEVIGLAPLEVEITIEMPQGTLAPLRATAAGGHYLLSLYERGIVLPPGRSIVRARLREAGRAEVVETREIFVDRSAPVIEHVSPIADDVVRALPGEPEDVVLSAHVDDSGSGIDPDYIRFEINGIDAGPLILTSYAVTKTVPAASLVAVAQGGVVELRVYARDRAGIEQSSAIRFFATEVPDYLRVALNERLDFLGLPYPRFEVGRPGTLVEAMARARLLAWHYLNPEPIELAPQVSAKVFWTQWAGVVTEGEFSKIEEQAPETIDEKILAIYQQGSLDKRLMRLKQAITRLAWTELPFEPGGMIRKGLRLAPGGPLPETAEMAALGLHTDLTSTEGPFELCPPPLPTLSHICTAGPTDIASMYVEYGPVESLPACTNPASAAVSIARHARTVDYTAFKNNLSAKGIVGSRFGVGSTPNNAPPGSFKALIRAFATNESAELFRPSGDAAKDAALWQTLATATIDKNVPLTGLLFDDVPAPNGPSADLPDRAVFLLRVEEGFPEQTIQTGGACPNFQAVRGAMMHGPFVEVQFDQLASQYLLPNSAQDVDAETGHILIQGSFRRFHEVTAEDLGPTPPGSKVRFTVHGPEGIADHDVVLDEHANGWAALDLDLMHAGEGRRRAGDQFQVSARLIEIAGMPLDNMPALQSGVIRVVPGPAKTISPVVEEQALCADGWSWTRIRVTARDSQQNLIDTPAALIRWEVIGDLRLINADATMRSTGTAFAWVRAGVLPGLHEFEVGIDEVETSGTIETFAPTLSLTASPPLTVCKGQSAPVTLSATCPEAASARYPYGVADGARVVWSSVKGSLRPFVTQVTAGSAQAVLHTHEEPPEGMSPEELAEGAHIERTGKVHILASLGNALVQASTDFLLPPDAPVALTGGTVILGDETADTPISVLHGDGEEEQVLWPASAAIKVVGTPGDAVNVLAHGNAMPVLRYSFDRIVEGKTVDEARNHDGVVNGATLDETRRRRGPASFHFDGNARIDIVDAPDLRATGGFEIEIALRVEGADGVVVAKGDEWGLVLEKGYPRLFVRKGKKLRTLRPPVRLLDGAWHVIKARYEGTEMRLEVDGFADRRDDLPKNQPLAVSASPLVIGSGFVGNMDSLSIFDPAEKLVELSPGSQVTIGVSGTADLFVHSLGNLASAPNVIFAGVRLEARREGPAATASDEGEAGLDCVRYHQLVLMKKKELGYGASFCYGFIAGTGSGESINLAELAGDITAGFLIYGDVRDGIKYLYQLLPGGDEPDHLLATFALIGLITTLVPELHPFVAAAKVTLKLVKKGLKFAKGLADVIVRLIRVFFSHGRARFLAAYAVYATFFGVFVGLIVAQDQASFDYLSKDLTKAPEDVDDFGPMADALHRNPPFYVVINDVATTAGVAISHHYRSGRLLARLARRYPDQIRQLNIDALTGLVRIARHKMLAEFNVAERLVRQFLDSGVTAANLERVLIKVKRIADVPSDDFPNWVRGLAGITKHGKAYDNQRTFIGSLFELRLGVDWIGPDKLKHFALRDKAGRLWADMREHGDEFIASEARFRSDVDKALNDILRTKIVGFQKRFPDEGRPDIIRVYLAHDISQESVGTFRQKILDQGKASKKLKGVDVICFKNFPKFPENGSADELAEFYNQVIESPMTKGIDFSVPF